MRNPVRRFAALGAFFVVSVALAACGSGVPGDSVADVAGNPITTRAFDHWMYVAAKSQAAQSPGAPVIVPNDPPNFNNCIAQVRKQVPQLSKDSDKTIRTDCKSLFTTLSNQVLDFLIKGYWYQAEATREHIKVTDAQVQKAFDTAKKQQFPTAAGFNTFLSQTGQTLQDILFRFRINQVFKELLAHHSSKVTPADIQAYYNSHLSPVLIARDPESQDRPGQDQVRGRGRSDGAPQGPELASGGQEVLDRPHVQEQRWAAGRCAKGAAGSRA